MGSSFFPTSMGNVHGLHVVLDLLRLPKPSAKNTMNAGQEGTGHALDVHLLMRGAKEWPLCSFGAKE